MILDHDNHNVSSQDLYYDTTYGRDCQYYSIDNSVSVMKSSEFISFCCSQINRVLDFCIKEIICSPVTNQDILLSLVQ